MSQAVILENEPITKEDLVRQFYRLVSPSLPNEWEVESIIDEIADLPQSERNLLFAQIPVIWPISNSLCLSFLEDGCCVIKNVPEDLIPKWVRAVLRRYEQQGLASARDLIVNVEELFLKPLRRDNLVRFDDVRKRMLFYLRGISGEDLDIALDPVCHTNTTTFYVPVEIALLDNYRKNQLLYKFLLTLHWGFQFLGTFRMGLAAAADEAEPAKRGESERGVDAGALDFKARFDHPELAADLFFLIETGRVMHWLRKDLPGLAQELDKLKQDLKTAVSSSSQESAGAKLTVLGLSILFGGDDPGWLASVPVFSDLPSAGPEESMQLVEKLYGIMEPRAADYHRPALMDLLGKHDFTKAAAELERKRAEMKETFILQLQALQINGEAAATQQSTTGTADEADLALVVVSDAEIEERVQHLQQIIANPEIELPEELLNLINRIKDDLGHVPPSYFSAAAGVSGAGFSHQDAPAAGGEGLDGQEGILMDEWDYRRNGFRKNWCRIYERDMTLLHSTFVDTTLEKHRGLLLKLRRQFEFMKTNEHFVRRQREGDDLDLDAIVEARGDQRAGLNPSSKLFVRLQRNERDIATLFLIDMSNSTEGWVGTVIKEALVLLCEVMDVAGDPYGILGFSGMRRSRCDLYRIKDLEEPYNRLIHQRINSILPREYTRMGPAVRYAANALKHYEARTRMLVVITDGKPEDYDDYKGEYAIEDTRKALMETRGAGIHTFCITVDREAHDYLPQMCGRGNYIFINEIDKLPLRMIDMYRQLTG